VTVSLMTDRFSSPPNFPLSAMSHASEGDNELLARYLSPSGEMRALLADSLPSPPWSSPASAPVVTHVKQAKSSATRSSPRITASTSSSSPTRAPILSSTTGLKRKRGPGSVAAPSTNADLDRLEHRREQNRRAQRAFRARREGEVTGLRSYVMLFYICFTDHS
jgi:hypothetical protein